MGSNVQEHERRSKFGAFGTIPAPVGECDAVLWKVFGTRMQLSTPSTCNLLQTETRTALATSSDSLESWIIFQASTSIAYGCNPSFRLRAATTATISATTTASIHATEPWAILSNSRKPPKNAAFALLRTWS